MLTAGIDPGLEGALAIIENGCKVVDVIDMPRDGGDVDSVTLFLKLQRFGQIPCVLEKVQVISRKQITPLTHFSMGRTFQAALSVAEILGWNVKPVVPLKWKNYFSLGSIKDQSISMALGLYPDAKSWISLKKHHNRAEAVLMAHYCHYLATTKGEFREPRIA